MKWLGNTYNPEAEDWKRHVFPAPDETHEEACENHKRWLADKIIGWPQGNEYYMTNELEAMDLVGVCKDES